MPTTSQLALQRSADLGGDVGLDETRALGMVVEPDAQAPSRWAASASSRFVMPQTLIRMRQGWQTDVPRQPSPESAESGRA